MGHGDTPSAPNPSVGAGAAPDLTLVVVGGGIAGLSAAWELTTAAPGSTIVVLESTDRLGGKLRTGEIGGRAVDLGPDAFLARRPEALTLCRELGLEGELVSPGGRGAYVWARGALRRLPGGLALGVPTRLGPLVRSGILSPSGVGRSSLDLLGWHSRHSKAPEQDRSVADITRQRLGHEVTARLVDPLIGGIHAGDTARMSAAAVFPALLDAATRGGSLMRALRPVASPPTPPVPVATGADPAPEDERPIFHSVRGGLERLVDALDAALRGRGVEVRRGAGVTRLERRACDGAAGVMSDTGSTTRWAVHTPQGTVEADAVVIATPAPTAAALLESIDRDIATALGTIDYADVTLVTMRLPADGVDRALDGTGFLVPASSGCLITACTWLTSKWPELQRPGDVLLRASMGRFGDDRPKGLSDDELVGRVLADLGPMLGLRAAPIEAEVTRWTEAFPQYDVGHLQRVSSIELAVARLPALALAGAAYHGVGIPACISSGRHAARAVLGRPVAAGLTTT